MACRKRCWLREPGCGCLLAGCWPAGGRYLLCGGGACRDYGGAGAGGGQGLPGDSWGRAAGAAAPQLGAGGGEDWGGGRAAGPSPGGPPPPEGRAGNLPG